MDCIIIEDQAPARRILEKYIKDLGTLNLKGTFTDAIQAMEYLSKNHVDVIFLDIHLPKISGIEFLKSIPHPPKIILTTAFQDYALEGYELNVVDYLLKPFSFQRFVKAVSKVQASNHHILRPGSGVGNDKPSSELFIKSGYEHIKIHIPDIIYIKSDADYTELYLFEKKHLSSESLQHWEEFLDEDEFTRVHKSYIVNVAKIEKVMGNQIYLDQNHRIPIGRVYKEAFMEKFIH